MGPCVLGKDKLKRPKKWTYGHKDVENKMRFLGITESVQNMNFLRTCAGAELTKVWEKEVRVLFEVTREWEMDVPAHNYRVIFLTGAPLKITSFLSPQIIFFFLLSRKKNRVPRVLGVFLGTKGTVFFALKKKQIFWGFK